MTPESVRRVQSSFAAIVDRSSTLSPRFYDELFRVAPELRRLFPPDLAALQGHFDSALALVIRNLGDADALLQSLHDLGAQHVGWGARPGDYLVARDALLSVLRTAAPAWDVTLERDWREAITSIAVPMLQGAAVETAVVAERLAADFE